MLSTEAGERDEKKLKVTEAARILSAKTEEAGMPIYEYVCSSCEHRFETLVRGSEKPSCPKCQGSDLDKQFSVFGVGGRSTDFGASAGPGACGTCGDPRGPGACSMD
jgi:putative FmdB family regulatory protein